MNLKTQTLALRRATARKALAAHGTLPGAAKALQVHVRTLQRWITADPRIAAGLEIRGQGWQLGRARS